MLLEDPFLTEYVFTLLTLTSTLLQILYLCIRSVNIPSPSFRLYSIGLFTCFAGVDAKRILEQLQCRNLRGVYQFQLIV